jgi:hypothetical protein
MVNIKAEAPDQNVWDIATTLLGLSDKTLYDKFLNEGKLLTK